MKKTGVGNSVEPMGFSLQVLSGVFCMHEQKCQKFCKDLQKKLSFFARPKMTFHPCLAEAHGRSFELDLMLGEKYFSARGCKTERQMTECSRRRFKRLNVKMVGYRFRELAFPWLGSHGNVRKRYCRNDSVQCFRATFLIPTMPWQICC